jgi:hypothetical protein
MTAQEQGAAIEKLVREEIERRIATAEIVGARPNV